MATTAEINDLKLRLQQVSPIEPLDQIADSVTNINSNYSTLYLAATGIEDTYDTNVLPLIEFFKQNQALLYDSLNLYKNYQNQWTDFLTLVTINSAKLLKPMSVFYPTIILSPIEENDITQVNNWLRKYFPIRNSQDGTLNYPEGQVFYVNCYTYNFGPNLNILDQPSSQCACSTQSGNITLHCITRITGGWIHCSQGAYNCNRTINCYPSLNVDCWYESPYLKSDGTPIRTQDPVSVKQVVISKIQANITMNYRDRREDSSRTLIFRVSECDWQYSGIR